MLMLLCGDGDETPVVYCQLAGPLTKKCEPAGQSHFDLCLRRSGYSSDNDLEESDEEEDIEYILPKKETKENIKYLRGLNPSDWKEQDHYAVLGLKDLRYKASAKHIKDIYKLKLLWHHPDKRRAEGESIDREDADYFCCITKAYEILGDKTKRKSYDSYDPTFEDSIPNVMKNNQDKFYNVFGDCFESNARFSIKKNVPRLETADTPFEEVTKFYDFWYNFESWRDFSYDQEEEKGESREERRWYERQNKVVRQKKKKEENTRIRQLVDNAYASDPRIIKHRQDERDRKEAEKKAKQEARQAKIEEERRLKREKEEEEKRIKEKEEEEARIKREKEKKQKDILKKAFKKIKKNFLTLCKDNEYFSKENKGQMVENMAEVDRISNLLSLEKLKELYDKLEKSTYEECLVIFSNEVKRINEDNQREIENMANGVHSSNNHASQKKVETHCWSPEELQLLTKAVNIYPPGTVDRWEQIASFLNLHKQNLNNVILAKQVLSKTKELQKLDASEKIEANSKAYELLENSHKKVTIERALKEDSTLSQRFDTPAEQSKGWTGDEQKLLEYALKKYPASTPTRWDRIAESIPGRSTKECITRYKKIVEIVKAQKAAAAAASAAK